MPYGGFFCQGGEGNSIGCAPFVIIPLLQSEVEDLSNLNERDTPHLLVDFLWESGSLCWKASSDDYPVASDREWRILKDF
jgi:hypothetical protein